MKQLFKYNYRICQKIHSIFIILILLTASIPPSIAQGNGQEKTGKVIIYSYGENKEPLNSEFKIQQNGKIVKWGYLGKDGIGSFYLPEGQYTVVVDKYIIFDKVRIIAGKDTEVSAEFGKLTVYSFGVKRRSELDGLVDIWQDRKYAYGFLGKDGICSFYLPGGEFKVAVNDVDAKGYITIIPGKETKVSAEPGKLILLPPEYGEQIILASDDDADLVIALMAGDSIRTGVVITPKGEYKESVMDMIKSLNPSEVWIVGYEDVLKRYREELRKTGIKFEILGGPTKELTSLMVFERVKEKNDSTQALISSASSPLISSGKLPIYIQNIENAELYLSDNYGKITVAVQKLDFIDWLIIKIPIIRDIFGKDIIANEIKSKQIEEIAIGYDVIPSTKEMVKEARALVNEGKEISKKEGYVSATKVSEIVNKHGRTIENYIEIEKELERSAYLKAVLKKVSNVVGDEEKEKIEEKISSAPEEEVGSLYNWIGIEKIFLQNDYTGAAYCFLKAAEADNDNPVYLSNLAVTLQLLSKPRESAKILSYVKHLEPKNPSTSYNLGCIHSALGMHKEATGDFREASQLDKNRDEYPHALGVEYLKLGENAKAAVAFGKVISINSSHEEASQRLKQMVESPHTRCIAPPPAIKDIISGLDYVAWVIECSDYEYEKAQKYKEQFGEIQKRTENIQKLKEELKEELEERRPYASAIIGDEKIEWIDTNGDGQLDTEYVYKDKNGDGEFTEDEKVSERKFRIDEDLIDERFAEMEREIDIELERLENEIEEFVGARELAYEIGFDDARWEELERMYQQMKESAERDKLFDLTQKLAGYGIEREIENSIVTVLRDKGLIHELLNKAFSEEELKELYEAMGEDLVLKVVEWGVIQNFPPDVKKNIVSEARNYINENRGLIEESIEKERDVFKVSKEIEEGIKEIVERGIDYEKISEDEKLLKDLRNFVFERRVRVGFENSVDKLEEAYKNKNPELMTKAVDDIVEITTIRARQLRESNAISEKEHRDIIESINDIEKDLELLEAGAQFFDYEEFAEKINTVTKAIDSLNLLQPATKAFRGVKPTEEEAARALESYWSYYPKTPTTTKPPGIAINIGEAIVRTNAEELRRYSGAFDAIGRSMEEGSYEAVEEWSQRYKGFTYGEDLGCEIVKAIEDIPVIGHGVKFFKWLLGLDKK